MRGDANHTGASGHTLKAARPAAPTPERVAGLVIGAFYVGTLLLLPWLSAGARLAAAAATAAVAGLAWTPASGRVPRELVRAAGVPLHLLTLATGGLASPVFVAFIPWLAWTTLPSPARRRVPAGAAVFLLLLGADAWARHGFDAALALEAGFTVACGHALALWLQELDRRARTHERALSRILDEAGLGRASETAEAARRIDELGAALDRLRDALGADHVVLWDVDPETERARPRLVRGGAPPGAVPLRGDPLGWAWDEGMPLRVESAPRWVPDQARACVLPIEPGGTRAALLSMTFLGGVEMPATEALEAAAAQLRALLHVQRREAIAVATRERYAALADVLRRLPREPSLDDLARVLASAGMRLIDGSGAAVALWHEEEGRILAVAGEDGGPRVGATFAGLESEMGLAARRATTLVRDRRHATRAIPVASADERWSEAPASLVVVALQDAGLGVVGVLAAWRSDGREIDAEAVEILEMLAPYAALQLHQARAYGDLREHAASAEHDALTGIPNRRAFDAQLEAAAASFHRYGRPFSLILLDVDHFKQINDTYGHEAGDAVLQAIAARLAGAVREVDHIARYGGEEFVVLLPETGLAGAVGTAERLRLSVASSPVDWRDKSIPVHISLGVSAVPECVTDPRAVVASADRALYESKEGGRNRVTAAPLGVDAGP
ncbi:MAG TPA: GGDEF domain-containing protein [Longimicrobiales bacterium]